MPRPPDRGDRLMMAFARRCPWRFAFLVYFCLLGSFTLVNDLVLPGRLQPSLRYTLPIAILAPHFAGMARRRVCGQAA